MMNFVTSIFRVIANNPCDLSKVEKFLNQTFDGGKYEKSDLFINGEFYYHRGLNRERFLEELIDSLEEKDNIYICMLSYEFYNEYMKFGVFADGEWKIKMMNK